MPFQFSSIIHRSVHAFKLPWMQVCGFMHSYIPCVWAATPQTRRWRMTQPGALWL